MKLLTILFFCLTGSVAFSETFDETPSETPWELITQWDNDILLGKDDGYTNGARFSFAYDLDPKREELNILQRSLKALTGADQGGAINDLRFPSNEVNRMQFGFGLSQLMYTPKNDLTVIPAKGERPYAGWLGVEMSLQASGGGSANTATLSVGLVGPRTYAEDLQSWIHENISDSPEFQGWDSQAPSELTINLHLDHKDRLDSLRAAWDWPIQLDGFYEWGGSLGNYRTDIFAGAQLRFGYNLPTSHSSPSVQLGSLTNAIFEEEAARDSKFSLYGFVGGRVYGVLHDITLDGPWFRDWDHSVDSELIVAEVRVGFAARYDNFEISLSHTVRTDEFEGQENRSRFGSVQALLCGTF